MYTVNNFVKTLVSISLMDDGISYGHYPFSGIVEEKDNNIIVLSLAMGGDVLSVYKSIGKYIVNGAKKAYFSLDFPSNIDLDNDFIAVFSYDDGKYNIFAIPYDVKTGEKFEEIYDNVLLTKIMNQFKDIVNIERKKLGN